MKWIKLFEEFQMGDLNFMSPEEIQKLFIDECEKRTPDLNLIRVILDNGLVDVNSENKEGRSPLTLAVLMGNIALAEYLISAGANVNVKGEWGNTPLHWASYGGNIAFAKLLISAGADVNTKDEDGNSPLRVAVEYNKVALAKLLISAGADVNTKDEYGWSPLALVVRRGYGRGYEYKEMQSLLKQHGAVE